MFRLVNVELGTEYVDVPSPGEYVLGRGPFLKVSEHLLYWYSYAPQLLVLCTTLSSNCSGYR